MSKPRIVFSILDFNSTVGNTNTNHTESTEFLTITDQQLKYDFLFNPDQISRESPIKARFRFRDLREAAIPPSIAQQGFTATIRPALMEQPPLASGRPRIPRFRVNERA